MDCLNAACCLSVKEKKKKTNDANEIKINVFFFLD